MNRTNVIQLLINEIQAEKYLEISDNLNTTFGNVICKNKTFVGSGASVVTSSSDAFFEKNTEKFDVIFVDGLHHSDQVFRDILNSLDVLNDGGYIICHDMNPQHEDHQRIPFTSGHWNGDCWKAFVQMRTLRDDLEMYTVDTDEGCSVIRKGTSDKLIVDCDLTYSNLESNRTAWLNLITVDEFMIRRGFNLREMITEFINDPESTDISFRMGVYYQSIGQCATAISYYIRTAERTTDTLLQYECLVRAAMGFETQGIRKFSVKGMLQRAMALHPERPEAHYLLSRIQSNVIGDGNWYDSYTTASVGLKISTDDVPPLRTPVDYPGRYALKFCQANSAWWCGLCDESRELFIDLYKDPNVDALMKKEIKDILVRLNVFNTASIDYYYNSYADNLRHKFKNSENIQRNHAESYQDMFVLSMLDGKTGGTYLEIGSANPFYGSNTALLETDFDWKGVSIDINEQFVQAFSKERKNLCLVKDGTTLNYTPFLTGLGFKDTVDYLQIDCDPPEISYKVLLAIPFETFKFAVITFEHDYYTDPDNEYRELSRRYLESYGYQMVVNDIAPDEWRTYEDWWVHPDLVDPEILNKMQLINDNVKKAEDYMLGKL